VIILPAGSGDTKTSTQNKFLASMSKLITGKEGGVKGTITQRQFSYLRDLQRQANPVTLSRYRVAFGRSRGMRGLSKQQASARIDALLNRVPDRAGGTKKFDRLHEMSTVMNLNRWATRSNREVLGDIIPHINRRAVPWRDPLFPEAEKTWTKAEISQNYKYMLRARKNQTREARAELRSVGIRWR
jgi:hypothetical protein